MTHLKQKQNYCFFQKTSKPEKKKIFVFFKRLDLTLHISKLIPTNTNTRHNYAAIQNQ